jgi:metallophosphoesterase superfamily enzyme
MSKYKFLFGDIRELNEKGLTKTEIARELIVKFKLDENYPEVQTDSWRKFVSKYLVRLELNAYKYEFDELETTTTTKLAEQFVEDTVIKPTVAYTDTVYAPNIVNKNNPKNVLVIPDLHLPYETADALSFCKYIKSEFNCGKVILIGDEIDGQAISYHESDPDLASAGDELKLAKKKLQEWYKEFPDVTVTYGNHSSLIMRKLRSVGLPSFVAKSYNEIFGTHKWNYTDEYEYNGTLYTHGTGLSAQTVEKKVMYSGRSVVHGHLHTLSRIQWFTQRLFTMSVGCLIDTKSKAFAYAKDNPKPVIHSVGVVIDKLPILITK